MTMISDGRFDTERLAPMRFPLGETDQAVQAARDRQALRVVVTGGENP